MKAFEACNLTFVYDLSSVIAVVDLSFRSLELDEFLVGAHVGLFSVSKSFQKGIWLQSLQQCLNIDLFWSLLQDKSEKLFDLLFLWSGNLLGSFGVYTLADFDDGGLAKFVHELSQLALFDRLLLSSLFLLDIILSLLLFLQISVKFIGCESNDTKDCKVYKRKPGFNHGDDISFQSAILENQVEPNVGEERCNTGNSKHTSVFNFLRLFTYCKDRDSCNNKKVKSCRSNNC
jgi:hypothetical protein